MGWHISVQKYENDPARIEVSGDMVLDGDWVMKAKWLYEMIRTIGTYDEGATQG